ncbi:MAG: hypothetical protein ACTSUE_16650 [Promethearchaeota archaeon]
MRAASTDELFRRKEEEDDGDRKRKGGKEERKTGEIQVIFGPMFAGKSTEMLRRLRCKSFAGNSFVIVKWTRDRRIGEGSKTMKTHDKGSKIPCIRVSNIMEASSKVMYADCIGIDDGHFFGSDIIKFCEEMANKYKKTIIISALDSTFERKPFMHICNLIAKAESVKKLKAVCLCCGHSASFSFRTSDGRKEIDVGGKDKYVPLCRECHIEQTKLKELKRLKGRNSKYPKLE